ncbi:hypothetical protein RCL1_003122 [Eukaryota sp. TZLM3-RCL]
MRSEAVLDEFETYCAQKFQISATLNIDLVEFWMKNSIRFPTVAKFALDVLTAQATSVPSEQLFSKGGLVVNKRRSLLSPDTVQAVLCLESWKRKNISGIVVEAPTVVEVVDVDSD